MARKNTGKYSQNALHVLQHRYLAKAPDGQLIETPEKMFFRVARAVANAESRYGADDAAIAQHADTFYRLMLESVFLPNSPTLMNAGRELGMLSACFLLPVPDSIEGIFDSVKAAALIQKAGGGTGFAFDRLRPAGDFISTSGGTTSGPMSFWRVFSEATNAIQQGAFRRGANMGMMNITHPDVLKFITAKTHLGAFENFNISIKVGNDFMDLVEHHPDGVHQVANPRTGKLYALPHALDLANYTIADLPPYAPAAKDCYRVGEMWHLMVACAHASGEPGLCFIDRVNEDNPTPQLGRIEATNPCGEQPLLDYEACNLGSINLGKFASPAGFDEPGFRAVVPLGVRFLDDVVDVNNYVLPEIARICLGNRKIGLGVMGFADALLTMGIRYDSDQAVAFAQQVARALTEEAFAASQALAQARGNFPNYLGSLWEKRGRKMRNAAVTSIAPTGTISIIADCSGGIEPLFALAYWRNILSGQHLLEVNGIFEAQLERRGIAGHEIIEKLASGASLQEMPQVPPEVRDVFVTAHDVPPQRHVEMQAAFQPYIDGAISKTINLPAAASAEDVEKVFLQAYHSRCKGITVYRHGSRPGQPMGYEAAKEPVLSCPRCQAPLDDQIACSRCPACGYTICS